MDKVQSKFLNSNCRKVIPRKAPQKKGLRVPPVLQQEVLTQDRPSKGHRVITYTQGLGESIKKICRKCGIQTHFEGNRTIRELLVKPKDKNPVEKKSGATYVYKCGELACDEEYTGETPRTLGERTRRT